MGALGYHLVFRLADDRVLFPTRASRRLAARVLLDKDERFGLTSYGAADTHLHCVVRCGAEAACELARAVGSSLRKRLRLEVPFAPTRRRPITDQWHFYASHRYVLRQEPIRCATRPASPTRSGCAPTALTSPSACARSCRG
jgi:hypothetical protein